MKFEMSEVSTAQKYSKSVETILEIVAFPKVFFIQTSFYVREHTQRIFFESDCTGGQIHR
jgi:hypothetical protein